MIKQIVTVAAVLSAGLIAGCGSGGSSIGSGITPAASTAVSGKVADGYLANATVFLDRNMNYQLDAGEPSVITDSNGAYTLTMDPTDVGKYPIVAIATKGVTIDKDTNLPVTNSYVLSMPAAAISGSVNNNFISPMSSQLRELMETGKYATIQDAMSALRTKLGLPAGIGMMDDYIAANNTTMHTDARNMATMMGSQMSLLFGTSGTGTTFDVNRYRGMMGTVFSNMPSIVGSGPNTQTTMLNVINNMMNNLPNIPPGLPFRNMSSAFRGGMMGGTSGGMMGGTSSSTSSGTGVGSTTGGML